MKEKTSLPKYFFGWKGALVLFLGLIIPNFLLSGFNVLAMMFWHVNYQYSPFFSFLAYVVSLCGAIFAFDYFVCRPQTGKLLNFNFSTKNFSIYFLVFPMMFGMMLVSEFLTAQIPVTGSFWGELYDLYNSLLGNLVDDQYVMIAMAVISAPILEEIVFRGIIQKGLINAGTKPQTAIFVSALIFGIIHGNPWQFVGAVLLGCVLGLVYYKTKSLLISILLHAFNNFTSAMMLTYGKTESFGDSLKIPEYYILIAGIIIFGVFYYLFMEKYREHSTEN